MKPETMPETMSETMSATTHVTETTGVMETLDGVCEFSSVPGTGRALALNTIHSLSAPHHHHHHQYHDQYHDQHHHQHHHH